MESSHDVLLASVRTFFETGDNLQKLAACVSDAPTKLSLRLMDYLTTAYARNYNIAYIFEEADGDKRIFNIYLEYKTQLKAFSKNYFDPFKRGQRVNFTDAYGKPFETTLGQLNFFRWALRCGVVEYARKNMTTIERDMNAATPKRARKSAVVVPELPIAPLPFRKSCATTALRVKITFR